MTIEITDNEKNAVIQQHLRNHTYNKYNLELSLLEENSATIKNQVSIDQLTEQLGSIDAKIAVLNEEASRLVITE
jgi:hypothetical protein